VVYFILLVVEMVFLFFLSRTMSKVLSGFMSTNLLSLLYLPGVIIHELSHLFIAAILFVPVGRMEYIPKKEGNSVKLGSVAIGKTDPIRRSIIGFAPVFVGLMIIVGIIYLVSINTSFFQNISTYLYITIILLIAYLLFAISNTMFSSSRDMEGTIEMFLALFIIAVAAYILGFRPSLTHLDILPIKEIETVLQKLTFFLLVPIAIDMFILGTIKAIRGMRT
jgi:hypothetical protein